MMALIDSYIFIEKLINSIPDPIFIKNSQLRFLGSKDAHCELGRLNREELIGKTDFCLIYVLEAKLF